MDHTKEKLLARITTADELACINAMNTVAHDLNEWLVLKHKGTSQTREELARQVTRMRRQLQAAMIDGGRVLFKKESSNWTDFALYDDFMRRLDHALTKMPAPRKASHQRDIAPRGSNVYFYRD